MIAFLSSSLSGGRALRRLSQDTKSRQFVAHARFKRQAGKRTWIRSDPPPSKSDPIAEDPNAGRACGRIEPLISTIRHGAVADLVAQRPHPRVLGRRSGIAGDDRDRDAGGRFAGSRFGGEVGFAEAYVDGDWTSPDPGRFFASPFATSSGLCAAVRGSTFCRSSGRLASSHARQHAARQPAQYRAAHYDLGNDFYASGSTRRCNIPRRSGPRTRPISRPRRRRSSIPHRRPGSRSRARESVLEIGCGWGGLAAYLALSRNAADVTAIPCRLRNWPSLAPERPFERERAARRFSPAGLSRSPGTFRSGRFRSRCSKRSEKRAGRSTSAPSPDR